MEEITACEVLKRLGYKGSAIEQYSWIKDDPDFPKPNTNELSGTKRWDSDKIDAFVQKIKKIEEETMSAQEIAEHWKCRRDYPYSSVGFPQPIICRGVKRWKIADIEAFIEKRKAKKAA